MKRRIVIEYTVKERKRPYHEFVVKLPCGSSGIGPTENAALADALHTANRHFPEGGLVVMGKLEE